jgi:hypothetical protein
MEHVDNVQTMTRGRFLGQRMDLGEGRHQALFWCPDDKGEGIGYCFDLPADELDDLIALLQDLKAATPVQVDLQKIESE